MIGRLRVVADDHVQAAEALRVGVRLVARVDDRSAARRGAAHALPDVLRPLADAVLRSAGGMQHLACTADQLTGDQERHQHVSDFGEVTDP